MKNAFRTTGSILAAALVAWFAVAVTPAEAYWDDYGFDYGGSSYGYDYGFDYGGSSYSYDYDYGFDYGGTDYGFNYDYGFDYGGTDYGFNYDYDYEGFSYDYNYDYDYGGDSFGAFGYTVNAAGYTPGYTTAYSWGGNRGGCSGSSCGNSGNSGNHGGCSGSSCGHTAHNDDLRVECEVSDTTIEEGDCVTYSADVDGGDSPFDYDWSGDTEGEDKNRSSIRVCYDDAGSYRVSVEVEDDDGQDDSDSCPTVTVRDGGDDDDEFEVECRVTDRTPEEGDCVTFSAHIHGGDSPFEYDWNGDLEGERDDNDSTIRVCYDDDGDYEVTIVVEDDDGNREADTCEIEVEKKKKKKKDDHRVSVFNDRDDSPSGTLASIDAVYLSQVPYTGPAETATLVATGIAVLGLGFGAAISLKKRAMRKETADRVAAFKAANLAKKVA